VCEEQKIEKIFSFNLNVNYVQIKMPKHQGTSQLYNIYICTHILCSLLYLSEEESDSKSTERFQDSCLLLDRFYAYSLSSCLNVFGMIVGKCR